MAKDAVEIFLLLQNARKFIEQAGQASHAVTGIGTAAEKSGKKASQGWKGMAKWVGGGAAIYGATRFIKGAIGDTTSLAKSTLQLQRVTGMETTTASEWVSVLKQRHVSSEMFGRTLAQLSKQMETARTGTNTQTATMRKLRREYEATSLIGGKKAPAALARLQKAMDAASAKGVNARKTFANLGVGMDAIRKGDTQSVILQIADRFKSMKNPAERAAAAQKLFGRSAQRLLPLLLAGRDGIKEQLDMQKKYGNTISGKSLADTRKLIHQQHEMEAAYAGVKVQLGTALLPVLTSLFGWIIKLVRVLQPFIRQGWLVKSVLAVLVIAFVAYKAAVVATTIAQLELTAAQWASLGVWLLVAAAIVGLVVLFVYLYKHVKWFHAAVDAMWHALVTGAKWAWQTMQQVWGWIKHNWPLLLGILGGPFALAVVEIIKHWSQVKSFVLGVIDDIKNAISNLFSWIKSAPGNIAKGVLSKVPGGKKIGGVLHTVNPFNHFANGGTMLSHGNALVGERGPEVVTLPRGARVTPVQVGQLDAGGIFTAHITSQLVVDRRVLAQAVATYTADKMARR